MGYKEWDHWGGQLKGKSDQVGSVCRRVVVFCFGAKVNSFRVLLLFLLRLPYLFSVSGRKSRGGRLPLELSLGQVSGIEEDRSVICE